MIAASTIEAIEKGLAEGTGAREISRLLHVSRDLIYQVRRGEVTSDGRRTNTGEYARKLESYRNPNRAGTKGRCLGCGGLVVFPCRLCAVRARKEKAMAEAVR